MDRELVDLARRHTVAVFGADTFLGSGFLLNPTSVVTCAHVAAGAGGPLTVSWRDRLAAVTFARLYPADRSGDRYYGFPDLALLTLESAFADAPAGVWPASLPPEEGATVVAYGFSDHSPAERVAPDTLRLTVVGVGAEFLRVQGDRIVPGFSGSLVLDEATGQVCGVVKASRDTDEVQGGWIIPVTALNELFADQFVEHRPGGGWFDLARGRARRQREIFGRAVTADARTPARLLVADQRAVPFVPCPELGELLDWCDGDATEQGIVRLVYAPGGAGKTRLADQLCDMLRARGWLAGFLPGTDFATAADRIVDALDAGFPVLTVIDYASDRLGPLRQLLTHLWQYAEPDAQIRILLLARSQQPWWEALPAELGAPGDWALYRARAIELPHLTGKVPAADLADSAFRAFADRLGLPDPEPPGSLRASARRHRSVLAVHALALDAALTLAQGDTWEPWQDPLVRIAGHEAGIWRRRLSLAGAPDLSAQIVPEALLLIPTLAPGRAEAATTRDLVRQVLALFPEVANRLDPALVTAVFNELYGRPDGTFAPIEPDRVAEVMVRTIFRALDGPDQAGSYLAALLPAEDIDQPTGLHVLARARGCTAVGRITDDADERSYERIDTALRYLLLRDPAWTMPAMVTVGAVLPHTEPLARLLTEPIDDCDPAILPTVERRLPRYPTDLSRVAAEVYRRMLAELGENMAPADRSHRVRLLTHQAFRLSEAGEPLLGLEAAREAAAISEDLVRGGGADHRALYAASLNNLSLRLAEVDDIKGSLRRCMSAERVYRELLDGPDPYQDHALDLAATLTNLAPLLRRNDQPAAAVDAAEEAVQWYERVIPSQRQEDGLAKALNNLALALLAVGAQAEAMVLVRRTVALYQDLAARNPARYLLDQLDVQHLLAVLLGQDGAGSVREAYIVMVEVARRRQSFGSGRPGLRDKQLDSLGWLRQWSADVPDLAVQNREWLSGLEAS